MNADWKFSRYLPIHTGVAPVGYRPTFNDGLGCSQVMAYSDESVGTDNVL